MLLQKLKRIAAAIAVGMLAFSTGPAARAGVFTYHYCNPSCEVFESPFFGYYPTCWRAWPAGQPICPPAAPPAILAPALKPDQLRDKAGAPTEPEMLKKPTPLTSPKE